MGLTITGGVFRGRRLATNPDSKVIRPTSGKVREALFSSLGDRVEGASFVDLYAGSGAVGLEALSRGAREVHLVENHPRSWALLKANCQALTGGYAPGSAGPDLPGARIVPVHADAAAWCLRMRREGAAFDLVFADPPFDSDFAGLWESMAGVVSPGGMAVVQFPARRPPGWIAQAGKVKRYGESGLAFLSAPGRSGPAL
jgi:16S rRNA (guanine966-N2)-methyltransferase